MTATPLPIDPDQDDDTSGESGRMGFLDHLDELQQRLIRSCLAIGAGMLIAFFFVDRIGDFILAPTLKALPAGDALIFTRPGEGFAFYLDVSFIGGILLAAPFVMYQVWQFIAPGLYTRERRFAIPFVALTTAGSIGGALFTHYIMFPGTIAFLAHFHSPAMKFVPRVEDTFDMYLSMMLGMVAVFQIPTLVFFLAKLRLVTAGFLWRHFKYAILVSFIVAAVLTPSADPWESDDLRGADDCVVRTQHRHRVAGRTASSHDWRRQLAQRRDQAAVGDRRDGDRSGEESPPADYLLIPHSLILLSSVL